MKTVTILFTLIAVSSSCLAAEPVDELVDGSGANTLEIQNPFGTVTVEGSGGTDVRVTGSVSDEAESLDIRRDGNRIIVHVIYPDRMSSRRGSARDTELRISAPRGLSLIVDTVDAGVTVSEIQGEQRLSSVSGSIETTSYAAEVQINTVSGSIELDGRGEGARVHAASVSGRVDLSAVGGEISSQNVSGNVSLNSPGLERAEVSTVSGNINVDATLQPDGRLRAQTTSGRISLELGDSPEGSYELSSFSGKIDNCFGPSPVRAAFGPPSASLQFDEESPSIQVFANSLSGDIELCRSESGR